MFEKYHNIYIARCFDLARLGKDSTSPNPSVGCVIVYHNRIIGEGWTQPFGGKHAEVQAFASVSLENRQFLPAATLYTSLEPCFHYGKTPPCVDLILREKIPHVVIAFKDPYPKVAGQSIEKLRLNGIEVSLFIANNSDDKTPTNLGKTHTLQPFFTNILHQRPYIILKWAESADGFIGKKNERTPISNELSKRLVHKWRSECDAIMVGTQTAQTDNPTLNNRFYFGKSPIRVVLDRTNRLDSTLSIFDNTIKTIVFRDNTGLSRLVPTCPENIGRISGDYREGGDTLISQTEDTTQIKSIAFDDTLLNTILKDLIAQKIGILLVEGGAVLLNSFIDNNLWDEARVITSSAILIKDTAEKQGIESPKMLKNYLTDRAQLADNWISFYKK